MTELREDIRASTQGDLATWDPRGRRGKGSKVSKQASSDSKDQRFSRRWLRRMSSGMLCRVTLASTDVSEEHSASIVMVTRIGWLRRRLAVTGSRRKLRRNTMSPWWWRSYVIPKRQFLQEPHAITFQKTAFFIVTAVNTSNLAHYVKLLVSCISSETPVIIQPTHYCVCSLKSFKSWGSLPRPSWGTSSLRARKIQCLATLQVEAIFLRKSILTRVTRRHISEDNILRAYAVLPLWKV
jgi:hypothetical protein